MDDKTTGSYYTPPELVNYMVQFIRNKFNVKSILEPSAGDGRFISALDDFHCPIHAIEIDNEKSDNLLEIECNYLDVTCTDFIDYAIYHQERYNLIIGNPPYITKKNLTEDQRKTSIQLLDYFKLPHSLFQNLWVSFILGSIKLLSPDGAIFFVLPFEFLQVQYAEKLRNFLETKFNTIEIITFEEKIFIQIEQDVCLVYLRNENFGNPFIRYTTIKSVREAQSTFESIIMRHKPLKKWSNCILNDVETETLESISLQYPQIKEFGNISPGIVTGANNFFITNRKNVDGLKVKEGYLKILSKSTDIANKLIFRDEDFELLFQNNKKVMLLNLNNIQEYTFSSELKKYLTYGEEKEINKRYKCSIRKRWYDVPIIRSGDVSFFKRYNIIPRIIINEAQVHTTDIAYNIRFDEKIDKESFAFCFYNSLTLVLCEYNGRFYGGGVGELVPNEFKDLHIPYKIVNKNHIIKLDSMFREKRNFIDIIDYVDGVVLDLSKGQKKILQDIRNRYLRRRLKK
ncbi:MAG: hypothetical protein CVV02_01505 [Firmicutes bacterium HGW-Firmicutes-7]|nr:MAG: hypothetical protein CVV02_01505 [Firmicutes bacterium HGW-Firmicutes-7]